MAFFITENQVRLHQKYPLKFEVRPRRGAKIKMADFFNEIGNLFCAPFEAQLPVETITCNVSTLRVLLV